MSAYDVRGRTVLITGAAGGIGLGTAKALHARGAQVALTDLDREATERAAATVGERAIGLAADVTDAASLGAAVAATVERFGGVDVVVANAGIAPTARTVRVYEPELFEKVLEVNLVGVVRTVQAAVPHVIARQGHVVVVSSIYSFINGTLVSPYAASKAAVEQFGRALRVELAPHGVSVGVAYFGFVETALVRTAVTDDPLGTAFEREIPAPLRKRISPDDAGEVLVRGIERRAASTIAPRRWAVLRAVRGVAGPVMDGIMVRHGRLQRIIRQADVEGRLPDKVA